MIPIENYSLILPEMMSVPVDAVCFYPEWYFHAWTFGVAMVTLLAGFIIGYKLKAKRG